MKGKFITFEGCEGAGKSRQIKLLCDYLDENGIKYVLTREPGGAPVSEKIREIILSTESGGMTPVTEALLFAAARAQHVHDVIRPNLEKGIYVLCDRYIDSSYAYQAVANGLGAGYIKTINERAMDGCLPDATIFLNLSPKDAFMRKGGADKKDRLEQLDIGFHQKVYDAYKMLAARDKDRYVVIDASGAKDETFGKIIAALKARGIFA